MSWYFYYYTCAAGLTRRAAERRRTGDWWGVGGSTETTAAASTRRTWRDEGRGAISSGESGRDNSTRRPRVATRVLSTERTCTDTGLIINQKSFSSTQVRERTKSSLALAEAIMSEKLQNQMAQDPGRPPCVSSRRPARRESKTKCALLYAGQCHVCQDIVK